MAATRKILSKAPESEEAGQENPDFLSDSEVSLHYLNLSTTGSTSAPMYIVTHSPLEILPKNAI